MAWIITARPPFVADLNDAFAVPGAPQGGSHAPVFMDK
jgi:hypothetical protein